MKKFLSILMVVALIAAMLTVGVVSTGAAGTATITIYGLDGQSHTEQFNVGDVFTVYTTLDASASAYNGLIGSVEGYQTYSADVLALQDEIGGRYGEIVDRETVFPITRNATMSNGSVAGRIDYNASTPSMDYGYKFDTAYSKLIVTTYKVTAEGEGEVRNALVNLAEADENLTKIVYKGEVQSGKSIDGVASFEDPTPEIDYAHVTIYKLDGTYETLDFDIGDTFTVYSLLNVKGSIDTGMVAAVQAAQNYTPEVLNLDSAAFPVLGDGVVTNTNTDGVIKYSASTPYIDEGFRFDTDESQLIATTYTVKANGFATITDNIVVLAAADEDATKIVFGGVTQPGMSFTINTTFTEPGTTPTQPPTRPTQPPTQAPVTDAPTQPVTESNQLVVTIKGPSGENVEKTVAVGSSFTVYTMLDVSDATTDGRIASVDGTQTFDTAKLQLTDAVSGEYNMIADKAAMFPILGTEAVATANDGVIAFNASRADVGEGYVFNSAESKLIVTNYKVLAGGTATVETKLKTLIADDDDTTKIVYKSTLQDGKTINLYSSYTDPGQPPTEAPTDAPTDAPTEAPTEAPTDPPADKAVITIVGFDGSTEVKTFDIGDEFTVYTTLDVSQAIENSMIAAISAQQTFPSDLLTCNATVDQYSVIKNTAEMFPIIGTDITAKLEEGVIRYNASTPYIGDGYVFDSEDSLMIVSKYTVTASGVGTINNVITTLGAADENLTRIINKGVVQGDYVIGGIASFTDPTLPPTEPPTDAPTEAPTEAPTDPPATKATVTITGIDGSTEVKTFNVGETFTVYTTLNASDALGTKNVSSVSAVQTFSGDILSCNAQVDTSGIVKDSEKATMFPIIGDSVMARVSDGSIMYNASTPDFGDGYKFNTDSSLLIVSSYTVTAAGTGAVSNSLTTLVADDAAVTRIVDKGVVQGDYEIDGIASFTEPVPSGRKFVLGDFDGNEEVESIDVTYLSRLLADMNVPVPEDSHMNADVDENEDLEIIDATYIQRWMADFNVPYPIGEWVER